MSERRVITQCTVSIDGYSSGPEGPAHDTWLHRHAVLDATSAYAEGVWRGCDTALLGRNNYQGFAAVWPTIAADPATSPRVQDLGRWLNTVPKALVSTTLTEGGWGPTRVFGSPAEAVRTLKSEPGRDVLVLNSASVIQSLLAEDLIDDLRLVVVPVLLGGGLRLLPDGVAREWELAQSTVLPDGAIGVHYRRA